MHVFYGEPVCAFSWLSKVVSCTTLACLSLNCRSLVATPDAVCTTNHTIISRTMSAVLACFPVHIFLQIIPHLPQTLILVAFLAVQACLDFVQLQSVDPANSGDSKCTVYTHLRARIYKCIHTCQKANKIHTPASQCWLT